MNVAVITPTRNRAGSAEKSLLEKAIYSVRLQTYKDHIHLIVDDGSSDCTKELVEYHSRQDDRIIYVKREKPDSEILTASNAINYGFNVLSGETGIKYYAVLHSDDIFTEKSIEERVEEAENNSSLFVFGDHYMIDDKYNITKKNRNFGFSDINDFYNDTKITRRFPHHTVLFLKDIIKEIGFYDSRIGYGEDCDMSLRMLKLAKDTDSEISYIEDFLVYYMMHDDSVSGVYKKNKWVKKDMKFVDKKNSVDNCDYYLKMAKRFLIKPHSFLPENVKKILRPVRDKFFMNFDSPYKDEFLERISKMRSDFWEECF